MKTNPDRKFILPVSKNTPGVNAKSLICTRNTMSQFQQGLAKMNLKGEKMVIINGRSKIWHRLIILQAGYDHLE